MKLKIPTPIFHSCAAANLPSVLAADGLWAKSFQLEEGIGYTNVAHDHIQDRRLRTPVSCGPGGVLHDYVPFYFNPRSPMLYAIHKGNVDGCPVTQREMIHLVAFAQDVESQGLGFVFTDGHGTMAFTHQFDALRDMDKVDWDIMRAQDYRDTSVDGDRKRRRQAEFLVHRFMPWSLIKHIAVLDEVKEREIADLLTGQKHAPDIHVRTDLFYLT